ncbi:MAG: DUF4279 domain-containing protein [Richelia sp. RM2_1_2]|nr:DUF4279 domain-containing protein [Richelia sp. RM2_1_2]
MSTEESSGDVVSVGGDIDRVKVSLRFFGDDLNPNDVSALLGCQPTEGYCKGEVMIGKRSHRVAHTGLWLLKGLEEDVGVLETKVSRLLDRVPAEPDAFQALSSFNGNVFCGVFLNDWNRGFSLSPEIMQRLTERKLSIHFDIYSNDYF